MNGCPNRPFFGAPAKVGFVKARQLHVGRPVVFAVREIEGVTGPKVDHGLFPNSHLNQTINVDGHPSKVVPVPR